MYIIHWYSLQTYTKLCICDTIMSVRTEVMHVLIRLLKYYTKELLTTRQFLIAFQH